MRDYQGRIYEDDCICPDCIHCDPVADECRKGRWRYPTEWLFNAENFFNAMSEWLKEGK